MGTPANIEAHKANVELTYRMTESVAVNAVTEKLGTSYPHLGFNVREIGHHVGGFGTPSSQGCRFSFEVEVLGPLDTIMGSGIATVTIYKDGDIARKGVHLGNSLIGVIEEIRLLMARLLIGL